MNGNKEYYDILCFYFFEPQHIGRAKKPDTKIKTEPDVVEKLRKLEVALNHQLNLFFRLAPDALVNRLLEQTTGQEIADRYEFIGREFDERFQVKGLTQPDIFLLGEKTRLSIELKLGAKSSLEQVAKYALLHVLVKEVRPAGSNDHLIYLGKGSFEDQWKERYRNAVELKEALKRFKLNELGKTWSAHVGSFQRNVDLMIDEMHISYLSYDQLGSLLINEHAELRDAEGDQTLRKLLLGTIQELKDRRLLNVGV